MKINWFKIKNQEYDIINSIRACLNAINLYYIDTSNMQFKYIRSLLTIGLICKDCDKEYWKCDCNMFEEFECNKIEEILYDFIIYNFSKKLYNKFIRHIKIHENIYVKFVNYYENKLV